jgi:hypothetical protein
LLTANNSERFRIASAGQLGIAGANYGTSGQVLTSGGSGAAPTWADAAGSGTTELTAAGALSAGDAVIINSSGQAEKIVTTIGSFAARSLKSIDSNSNTPYAGIAINQSTDATGGAFRLLAVFNDTGSAKAKYQIHNMATDGTLSNEYNVDVNSHTTRAVSLVWSDYLGEFAMVYAEQNANPNGRLRFRTMEWGNAGSVNPTSDASLTIFSNATFGDFQEASLVYDNLRNRYVCFYTYGTSLKAEVVSSTGAGGINHVGTGTVISSKEIRYIEATGDNNGTFVVNAYDSTGGDQYIYVFSLDASNNVTLESSAVLDTAQGGAGAVGIAYSSSLDKYLAYFQNGSNGRLRVVDVDVSSSYAITMGTAITVDFSNSAGLRGTVIHDDTTGFHVFFNDGNPIYHRQATVSGNTVSMSGSATEATNVSTTNYDKAFRGTSNNLGLYGVVFAMNNEMEVIPSTNPTTTNLSDAFIGFASASINSGATGDINVIGATDTNQSSLTAGSKYYVNGQGNLTTTVGSNQYAGLALSATKLLVKG